VASIRGLCQCLVTVDGFGTGSFTCVGGRKWVPGRFPICWFLPVYASGLWWGPPITYILNGFGCDVPWSSEEVCNHVWSLVVEN
jgi:hypothetical protein